MLKNRFVNLFILIIGFFLIINLTKSLYQMLRADDQVQEAEKRVSQAQAKNEELKKKLIEVESEAYLEKQAREKLGLSKEGERVVILPENSSLSAEQIKPTEENLSNWQKWWKLFF